MINGNIVNASLFEPWKSKFNFRFRNYHSGKETNMKGKLA
jgi:hypothetical protein